jgi:ATP/maltotriose-dependent transcriptional regulator MalT
VLPYDGNTVNDPLQQGRDAYRRRAWGEAFTVLEGLDRDEPLAADDLWLLATSAFLIGRIDDFLALMERTHLAFLDEGDPASAIRCAFWLGGQLAERGDRGRAGGWFARAQRLLDGRGEGAEHGYLLMPKGQRQLGDGDHDDAFATGAAAAEIARRAGDADLVAMALHLQGRARVRQGRIDEGLALLDEAMMAVAAREVSPIMAGLIHCSVIAACREVYALQRAREWTELLSQWCAEQPDLVPYAGQCLANRAEVLRLQGQWRDAIVEVERLAEGRYREVERRAVAAGFYQRGEIERLRGDVAAAEAAYREASAMGLEPQPGLALLRLAQGNAETAHATLSRALAETTDPLRRSRLLPAFVEVALARGVVDEGAEACAELAEIAAAFPTEALAALVAQARGAVELAAGDARAALSTLRGAWSSWQHLDAPYEGARLRMLVGEACRALGDHDTATLEFEAARAALARLGAAPALAEVEALLSEDDGNAAGLTPRELQVLRLVASGASNKGIAAQLAISDRTVERHLSNIFDKLEVPSRAAATAYAFRHGLV